MSGDSYVSNRRPDEPGLCLRVFWESGGPRHVCEHPLDHEGQHLCHCGASSEPLR